MKESVGSGAQRAELKTVSPLQRYKILGNGQEPELNELAYLASEVFGLPICIISFIGEDQVYYKGNLGFEGRSSEPLKGSFCGQLITPGEVIVLKDIQRHNDFFFNLHDIRFFAAAPLISPDGQQIGNFSVMGSNTITFSLKKQQLLRKFARIAENLIESKIAQVEGESLTGEMALLNLDYSKIINENSLLKEYQQQITHANGVLEGVLDSYELLFKYAPIAIGICSYNDKFIWQANDAMVNMFGHGSVVIGAELETLIRQVNGEVVSDILKLVNSGSDAFHQKDAKLQIRFGDGYKNIYVDFSLQLVGRMGDEPQNIMFILADVTEQVILHQIAEQANSVLMSAIEDTGMGYTVVEFETGTMKSNDQLKANYGYSSSEKFSYPDIFNAMLPKYRSVIKKAVNDAILNRGIYQAEYEVRWRDGSVHRIRAYGRPLYDADGKATHIIGPNKVIEGSKD